MFGFKKAKDLDLKALREESIYYIVPSGVLALHLSLTARLKLSRHPNFLKNELRGEKWSLSLFFKREKNTGIYNPQIGQAQLLDSFAGCALLQLGLYLWNHSHSNL